MHRRYDKAVQEFSSRHDWTSLELQSEAKLYTVHKAETVKAEQKLALHTNMTLIQI